MRGNFCFVTFEDEHDAEKAIRELDGTMLLRSKVECISRVHSGAEARCSYAWSAQRLAEPTSVPSSETSATTAAAPDTGPANVRDEIGTHLVRTLQVSPGSPSCIEIPSYCVLVERDAMSWILSQVVSTPPTLALTVMPSARSPPRRHRSRSPPRRERTPPRYDRSPPRGRSPDRSRPPHERESRK